MQIHLLDISSCDGKTIQESVIPELEKIDFQMGSFTELAKETVELTITNTGDKFLELTGTGKLSDEERVNDLDESSYLTGMNLDVDRLVYLEVLICWPLKVLCKEDCKGICSRCGKNLNEGPCGCKEEPKDPRMAAISDIFSKFKEV